jgi:hypothetical protein
MILTPLARVMNAVRFVQQNGSSTWAILGQSTPWGSPYSDSSPPPPDPTSIAINSPFCAAIATANWVIENDISGTYAFVDTQGNTHLYSTVATEANVISEQINIVMLSAMFTGTQLFALVASFRQIGFATNLIPTSGHSMDTFLPAAHISSYGDLEALENRVPVSIISASNYQVSCLIQF